MRKQSYDYSKIILICVCIACFLTLIIFLIVVSVQKSELFANNQVGELLGVVAESAMKLEGDNRPMAINPNVNRIITKELSTNDMKIEPIHIEKANKYHDTFNKYKEERLDILRKLYIHLGSPKTVVTMFYCKKFFIFFQNWVRSCEIANINVRDKTITFSLDQESYDKTIQMGFKSILISNDKYERSGGSVQFGDDNFSTTMFYKNAFIYDLLEIVPENNYVLFQDSDLIWFRDPIEYLQSQPEDIQIMYDGPNHYFKELYANTGFIFLRNNNITKSVMETALRNTAHILYARGHQKIFNRILSHYAYHNVLSLKVLPEVTFVNGHLLNNTTGKLSNKLGDNWKSNAYVMHYSWTGNIEDKFKKLDILGLNYIHEK